MEQLKWLADWCRPRFKFKWWLITYLTVGAVVAGNFDNLGFNGNTISSRNSNGNIVLDPNGTGQVRYNDLTASTFAYLDSNKDLTSQTATQATALLNAVVGDSGSGGTKGLVPAPAAGDTAALKFLKADGTWAVPANTVAYRNMTTGGNILTTDSIVELTGVSFTATLPTAVGVSGKVYEFFYNGTTFTSVYTLATTGGQTIHGLASGVIKLSTDYESLKIVSDGSNWKILNHKTESPWQLYTPSLLNLGTISTNSMWWRRIGDSIQIQGYFIIGTAAAAKPCGFTIPVNIDTTKIPGDQLNTLGWSLYNVTTTNTNLPDNSKGPFPLTYDAASGANYLIFSHNLDTDDALHAVNADNCSTLFTNGSKQAITTISIPVDGWQP